MSTTDIVFFLIYLYLCFCYCDSSSQCLCHCFTLGFSFSYCFYINLSFSCCSFSSNCLCFSLLLVFFLLDVSVSAATATHSCAVLWASSMSSRGGSRSRVPLQQLRCTNRSCIHFITSVASADMTLLAAYYLWVFFF